MATKIKICGITNLADARYCAGAGADYLGFIQYKPSPRYIDPKLAHDIIEWVHGSESVGVFVNEDPAVVNAITAQAGFDYVQLSGDETPADCTAIDKPVIKTIHVAAGASPEEVSEACAVFADVATYLLLDTKKAGLYGGTGEAFDWSLAQQGVPLDRLFVAGGIGPDNIAEVISTLNPFAVDLSSSVESEPGVKDFDKLAALFDARDALLNS